jgi:hypothetical protein
MSGREDRVVSAITTDGAFRVIAAITTAAVAHLDPRDAELATAAILLGAAVGDGGGVEPLTDEDVSSALMRRLQAHRIPAMASVAALPGPDGVRVAGGYLIELRPTATAEAIGEMTDHLGNLAPLATLLDGRTPSAPGLVAILMAGLEHVNAP